MCVWIWKVQSEVLKKEYISVLSSFPEINNILSLKSICIIVTPQNRCLCSGMAVFSFNVVQGIPHPLFVLFRAKHGVLVLR